MALKIDIAAGDPGVTRMALAGSLDSETAPQLEKALAEVDAAVPLVALDLQELAYISSAGLRVIFAAQKRQEAKQGLLLMTNMSEGVRKVFEIVRALPKMKVFSSVRELDAYLETIQKRKD